MNTIYFAIILTIAGLAFCALSTYAKYQILVKAVQVAGIILVIIGLILLCFPLLAWLHAELRHVMGSQ
jgi:hypothetical protein